VSQAVERPLDMAASVQDRPGEDHAMQARLHGEESIMKQMLFGLASLALADAVARARTTVSVPMSEPRREVLSEVVDRRGEEGGVTFA
jgi:hypothetical protein